MARGKSPKSGRSRARKSRGRKPLSQLSPSYRKRIQSSIRRGKSRQAARGHKPKEHVSRKEREIKERGISSAQQRVILNWVERWDWEKWGRDKDQLLEHTIDVGYDWFHSIYQPEWTKIRKKYLKALDAGKASNNISGYSLDEWVGFLKVPDPGMVYYH